MKKTCYYMLFDNHEQAVRMYRNLKKKGAGVQIAPTPRALTKCCGVAIMLEEDQIDIVREYIHGHEDEYKTLEKLEVEFDPKRDHYT